MVFKQYFGTVGKLSTSTFKISWDPNCQTWAFYLLRLPYLYFFLILKFKISYLNTQIRDCPVPWCYYICYIYNKNSHMTLQDQLKGQNRKWCEIIIFSLLIFFTHSKIISDAPQKIWFFKILYLLILIFRKIIIPVMVFASKVIPYD